MCDYEGCNNIGDIKVRRIKDDKIMMLCPYCAYLHLITQLDHERKIYGKKADLHELHDIREHKKGIEKSDPSEYPAFLWSTQRERWYPFSTDKRTANSRYGDPDEYYYILETYTERVNRARSNGFSYSFNWAIAIVRDKNGQFKREHIRL